LLGTTTIAGLHEFVFENVIRRFAHPGDRVVDLEAGSGLLAVRMRTLGCDVAGADKNSEGFQADGIPFVQLDLDVADFSDRLGHGAFSVVTAVEVIEHVESPIGFLRNVRRLLKQGGVGILTTPNVDNAPARVKFLLTEKIRMMDEISEPTHISPIFWDLLNRQFLPRAGLELVEHRLYPSRGYSVPRPGYAWAFRGLAQVLRGDCLEGGNHVFVLRPRGETA
jgi:2-polyprenyl-3-methyl-5-hydroxy-6-metoxy-1,4-benzoquinol methylase